MGRSNATWKVRTKEGRRRLTQLAAYLRKVPADIFNMSVWAREGFDNFFGSCETSACAIGHATNLFKVEGFVIVLDDEGTLYPLYKGEKNFEAVQSFFGLTDHAAVFLFGSTVYEEDVHPNHVANRITNFLDSHYDGSVCGREQRLATVRRVEKAGGYERGIEIRNAANV